MPQPEISDRSSVLRRSIAAAALHLALVICLCGCAVGPKYKPPQVDLPAEFRGAPALPGTNTLAEMQWWDFFKDPALKELVGVALTNNYDLKAAVARVDQARALLEQDRSLFFPQLQYEAAAGRGKNASGGNFLYTGGRTASSLLVGGNASWELDLWGRIRRLNEAARAQLYASEEARHDATISIISEVGQAYYRLLALDSELAIARRSTNSFGESLRIFSQRLEQGIVSKLESAAAEAALASAAATVPELERQIIVQENLINTLTGRNPGPVPRARDFMAEDMALTVPPGMPSDLLQRRPDIREAEQVLRSANAQVGVAVADFFPHLSLTGAFGQVSPELSAFTSGGANAWSIAGNLAGPLFQGGRLRARYRQAVAARRESEVRYRASVLNALQEVSNGLVSVEKFGDERVQQARAVKAYDVAVQVSMERYIAGRASYYEVLQEQQLLFPAERTLVEIKLSQVTALIQLYRALGGGFEL